MINILIVDDSETETMLLKHIFSSSPDMKVVGCAKNGKEAVALNTLLNPDIITMDILMPEMNGLEAIRLIMSEHPKPIVVISSNLDNKELQIAYSALEMGALSVLEKPINAQIQEFARTQKQLIDTVRNMAEIKVIKRRFALSNKSMDNVPFIANKNPVDYEIVAIGSSVGGPQALVAILSQLPADFPLPIAIVQHMTPGFIEGFTHWLAKHCALKIKVAAHDEILLPGVVYFAPDHHQLELRRSRDGYLITQLSKAEPVAGFCPSVTVLLNSVAKTCHKNAIGILLTGMGSDGAHGLLALKKTRAHTIVQDPESAVVYGMAGVAQSLGAVDKVVSLDQIADYLKTIIKPVYCK